ncbi:MAG: hypothetical protein ACYTDT_08245 [Planctomycetota bacterium]|jgi:hypothetical protein
MRAVATFLLLITLTACTSTYMPPEDAIPPSTDRQEHLTFLFDQFSDEDENVAARASKEAAESSDKDRRFLESLWGTRTSTALGAERFGHALSTANHHEDARDWFRRAFMHVEQDDPALPYLRYYMAREMVTLGQRDQAVDLLGNRLGLTPLPVDLEPKYAALLKEARG